MLDYLEKYHRISIATIYNDLHGFIRRNVYTEFLKGLASQLNAEKAKDSDEKHEHYEKAVRHYTESLKLKPDFADRVYNNRGIAYAGKGEVDRAIEDFSEAIALDPKLANKIYDNRGVAYVRKGEVDRAIEDFIKAIALKTLSMPKPITIVALLTVRKASWTRRSKTSAKL